jgi:hypothetical protein
LRCNCFISYLLTRGRQNTSKSAAEQSAVLLKFGNAAHKLDKAIDAVPPRQEGIGASVLDFLTSNVSSASNDTYKTALQQDLLDRIYQEDQQRQRGAAAGDEQVVLSSSSYHDLEIKFISCLSFIGMDDRESRITKAYESTFQWIF